MVLHLARKLQVEEVGRMQAAGFVAPLEEHWKYCPYCGKSLGKLEVMKRKKERIIVCKKCGKTIDERHIRW